MGSARWRPLCDLRSALFQRFNSLEHGAADGRSNLERAILGIVGHAQPRHIHHFIIVQRHGRLSSRIATAVKNLYAQRNIVNPACQHSHLAHNRTLSNIDAVAASVGCAPCGRLEACYATEGCGNAQAATEVCAQAYRRTAGSDIRLSTRSF